MNVRGISAVLAPRTVPILAVTLVCLLVALLLTHRDQRAHWYAVWDDGQHWDNSAVAVAKNEAINFFDLNHRRIEDDVKQVLSLATGDFATEYAKKRAMIVASVRKQQAVWKAAIPRGGSAVEYVGDDVASVLIAVDVQKSASGSAPTTERERVRIRLAYVDTSWLVSDVEEVG